MRLGLTLNSSAISGLIVRVFTGHCINSRHVGESLVTKDPSVKISAYKRFLK